MQKTPDPVVGQWYRHLDKGETFQVVDVDAGDGRVEVQAFDGNIDEFARAEWNLLAVDVCAPPEDWTGPYDDVERDDPGYTDTEMTAADWREPIEGNAPHPEEPYAEEQEAARHKLS